MLGPESPSHKVGLEAYCRVERYNLSKIKVAHSVTSDGTATEMVMV